MTQPTGQYHPSVQMHIRSNPLEELLSTVSTLETPFEPRAQRRDWCGLACYILSAGALLTATAVAFKAAADNADTGLIVVGIVTIFCACQCCLFAHHEAQERDS